MSTFTGQPHQVNQFGVPNTFQDGMNTDYPPEATPATGYVSAGNGHLLRYLGSEVLFSFDTATVRRCRLPDNHYIVGWVSRKPLLYLVLAEVINGVATGRGQVGTFPSPAYTYQDPADPASPLVETGSLTQDYRPLYVYLGDQQPYDQQPGPLTSLLFDFDLEHPLEVELQPSYDGSVNLLLHDRGQHAPLLVNSGFTVFGDNQYRILERNGQVSTNRYAGGDFQGRLQQQLRPQTAAQLALVTVTDGGRLPGGEYRYYLLYCDADGNQTGIACEVGPVSIFNGSSPALLEGILPGQNTTRRVRLRASNLDPSLGYVLLAYVRRAGEPSAVGEQAVRVGTRRAIPTSGTFDVLHTGLESETVLSADELTPLLGRVYRFVTTAATEEGRLLAGNITTGSGTDAVRDALRAYARTCNLGHSVGQLPEPGLAHNTTLDTSIPALYQTIDVQSAQLDGYAGGYANPLNICYRTGHHDAEAYAWCLQGQLLDGTLTDGYPLRGLDNLLGSATYENDSAAGYYDEQGWNAARTQNVAGVYRFPRRGLGGVPAMLDKGNLNVLRVEVQFPALPLLLQQNLRALRVVRAPRRPNREFQGYLIPTLRSLANNPDGGGEEFDHYTDHLDDILQSNSVSNLKVLPAPQLTLEASIHDLNNKKDRIFGVHPFRFAALINKNNAPRKLYDPRRYALYAPDVYLRMGQYRQQLGGSNWQVLPVAVATCWREVRYDNVTRDKLTGGSWTVYKTAAHALLGAQALQPAKFYTVGDNQGSVNAGRFGSHEAQLRGKNNGNEEFYVLRLAWEEYVGVEFAQDLPGVAAQLNLTETANQTGYEVSTIYQQVMQDAPTPLALVVDVYGPEGVWDGEALRQAYPPETTTYAPVTDWLTPTQLEQQLLSGRLLQCYGGDALIGLNLKRVNRANPGEQQPAGEEPQPLSQLLGLVTSNTLNGWPRSVEPATAEGNTINSFSPRLGAESNALNTVRSYPYNVIKESLRYNAGYGASTLLEPPLIVSARDTSQLLPFARTRFPQRVWSTLATLESALSNGWRYFPALLFKDYDLGFGQLMRLLTGPGGEVLLVYEYGLGRIVLNERAALGQQAGQPVYTQSLQLLPDRAQEVASDLGCQHAFGTCVSDAGAYGYSALHNVVWFYPWGGGKAVRLSDRRVSSRLAPVSAAMRGKPVELLTRDVRLTFDPHRGDVILNIYQPSAPLS